jgi:ribonuclease HI/probable phosphoglycerate mutase
MGKNNDLNRTVILKTIADKLPDAALKKLFPEVPAQAVRDVLLGKNNVAAKVQKQQNLFTELTPQSGFSCKLFTDGASRGNPGEAGAGIVLLDNDNQEIAARSSYLGQCTNNAAEYEALLLGLRTALELGCTQPAIHMDSQLIVRQIQGQYKVKNAGLKPLFDQAKSLLTKFDSWSIEHVPRARNKRADELANRGIDDKQG